MATKDEEERAARETKERNERAAAALEEARRHTPLNLLVEVVEYRYQERRTQDRRWWIGLAVAVFTAYVAAGAFYVAILERSVVVLEETANRAAAEADTANRRLDTPEQLALPAEEDVVAVGESQSIELGSAERARLRIRGVQDGTYTVDAVANGDDFDPVLYLYERVGSRFITLASDDDGGEALNSRIVEDLRAAGTYFVEVEEIVSAPGSFTLSVQPLPSSGESDQEEAR